MQSTPAPGSYSIVSTMLEDPAIVAAFVAHHLQMDADRIFIFLDAARPEVEAILAPLPRVRTTVCDDAYWKASRFGHRPDHVVRRQLANAEQAGDWARSQWLVHIDSDEFLQQSGSLGRELGDLPPAVNLVRIRNLERVLTTGLNPTTIFQGVFRDQITAGKADEERVYGPAARYLRNGLTGYVRGKTATRIGSGVPMKLHPPLGTDPDDSAIHVASSTCLYHFDGFTALHWLAKLCRRIDNNMTGGHKGRAAQMAFIKSASSRAERFALFRQLMVLDPSVQQNLAALGLLLDQAFDPLPAMKAVFPDRTFDLSAEKFDSRLVAANRPWYESLDLLP